MSRTVQLQSDSNIFFEIGKNSFQGTSQLSIAPQYYGGSNVLVYPDGEVLFIPQINIKVHCYNFSHSNWPQVMQLLAKIILFLLIIQIQGEQDCNIRLGSWTYDSLGLNLTAFNNKVMPKSPNQPMMHLLIVFSFLLIQKKWLQAPHG